MFCARPRSAGNLTCVNPKDYFVTAPPSSSALREIQAHLTHPATLAVQVGVALLLGLSGPFGTFAGIRPGDAMRTTAESGNG